ncbi:MAG TPA: GntR family transcriptional regulator [Lachnospiraceae bacterium]|nr:GntR family transcriptional regulator [Lachnospiraceae bacterium]
MYSVEFDSGSSRSLYVQIYDYLKKEIADGRIAQGERLPSIRNMAKMLGVSVTTVRMAYDQLIVEGYLESRPQSGYYVIQGSWGSTGSDGRTETGAYEYPVTVAQAEEHQNDMMYDPESFDFVKWKKCMASVLNDTPELLLSEGDRQGEPALRTEIAAYLYKSRGVVCGPEQVVISAGTQQLVTHIARILKVMGITLVCKEDPGYEPASRIFGDRGFAISSIPVRSDGIEIEKLPANIRSAVYVSPQNQFPTGALMPIGRRHRLLEWADDNDSIIIEDDYDSELRYFGMPVPALQGLDGGKRVIYIGSFTSTLFPAVRISYMVLPRDMISIYETMKMDYDQTCSKTEQLTLALFMQRGFYGANLRKIRNLYSHKLREAMDAIGEYGGKDGFASAENTRSGINIILRIDTGCAGGDEKETAGRLIDDAAGLGIKVRSIPQLSHDGMIYLIFYYNQIPAGEIKASVKKMLSAFRAAVRGN